MEKQVRRLAAALPGRTVTLADDSVFSGGTLLAVAALFTGEGVAVTRALCGAATADGTRHLAAQGIDVESVVELGDVLDNVSQRDFVAGVPMSGRTVPAAKRHRGAPYMLPFGKPVAWASIPPAHQLAFSIACLRQSIRLWEAVEAASGREAPSRALDKRCVGLADDISIATGLGRVLREMEGAAGDA